MNSKQIIGNKSETSSHSQRGNCSHGYITLLSVLVVGAVGVAISLSLILLGLGTSRSSLVYQQMHQSKALANACTEEALQRIRRSTGFTGTLTISLAQGSCTYTVTSQGGESRTIESTGNMGTIVRKVRVTLTAINPLIVFSSWREHP